MHPSIKDSAALYAVLPLQVSECLKARARREVKWREAERQWCVQAEAEVVNAEAKVLVDAWRSTSAEAHEAAVQMIGPDVIWDALAKIIA